MSGTGNQAQTRFRRGAAAYGKDGSRYEVEDVEDGTVYCRSSNGAETDFPAEQLMTEGGMVGALRWQAREGLREAVRLEDFQHGRCRPERGPHRQRRSPRLHGSCPAFSTTPPLRPQAKSWPKPATAIWPRVCRCRNVERVYEAAKPEVQAGIVAHALGIQPSVLVSAGQLATI
jgi:hypothetical protein